MLTTGRLDFYYYREDHWAAARLFVEELTCGVTDLFVEVIPVGKLAFFLVENCFDFLLGVLYQLGGFGSVDEATRYDIGASDQLAVGFVDCDNYQENAVTGQ